MTLTTRNIYSLRDLGTFKPSLESLMIAMHYEANEHGARHDGDWIINDGPGSFREMKELLRNDEFITFYLRHPRRNRNMKFDGIVRSLHTVEGNEAYNAFILCLDGDLKTGEPNEPTYDGKVTFFWNPSSGTGFVIMPTKLAMEVLL